MEQVTEAYNATRALWINFHIATASTQTSTAAALQSSYDAMEAKHNTALISGAVVAVAPPPAGAIQP
jgi:hypothetical protein